MDKEEFKDLLYEEFFDQAGEVYYSKIKQQDLFEELNEEFGEELTHEQKDIVVAHIMSNMEKGFIDGVKFSHKQLLK